MNSFLITYVISLLAVLSLFGIPWLLITKITMLPFSDSSLILWGLYSGSFSEGAILIFLVVKTS